MSAGVEMSSSGEAVKGELLTPEENYWLDWAEETAKRNLTFSNEVLRVILTLSSSLLGGAVVWLKDDVVHPVFRVFVIACLLAALGFSIAGVLPFQGKNVNIQSVRAIKHHKKEALTMKGRWLKCASFSLFAALAFALAGVAVKLFR